MGTDKNYVETNEGKLVFVSQPQRRSDQPVIDPVDRERIHRGLTGVVNDEEGTAYLTMGGGCHGCSMSKMTMLDGVQTMLSDAIEGITRVRDLTDHSTGENPFYS